MDTDARIRVAHVIPGFAYGGIERFVCDLARVAAGTHVAVQVCALDRGDGAMLGEYRSLGVPLATSSHGARAVGRLVRDLAVAFRSWRPDVVHSHVAERTCWVALAARLSGVRTVVATYHNRYELDLHHRLILAGARRLAMRSYAVSAGVQDWLDARYGLTTDLLRLGIDTDRFAPAGGVGDERLRDELGIPSSAAVVGTVGSLTPQKDPDAFLEVARAVAGEFGGTVRFLVVGEGPLLERCRERWDEAGLASLVSFSGARSDVERLYRLMDVFVLPSRWEGLPLALLEAQASGVAAVATRLHGTLEATDTGRTALLGTGAGELATHVTTLLRDRTVRASLTSDARRFVAREFGLASAAERHHALYESLAGGARSWHRSS